MTEEDRKFLTEAMGERWHEPSDQTATNKYGVELQPCSCGVVVISEQALINHINMSNRTFTTPDDFFAVWNHMVKRDDWLDFYTYCYEQSCYRSSGELFICWLIDPIRFPELAVEWLRKEKKSTTTDNVGGIHAEFQMKTKRFEVITYYEAPECECGGYTPPKKSNGP